MSIDIRGFTPQSLVDYPDNIAAVVFTAGCNMACPFCYNSGLVREPDKYERVSEDQVIEQLKRRRVLLDGLVITGGEPTLQPGLAEFIQRVKSIDMLVKLDTNGLQPQKLEELLPLVDYVAMDIKAAPAKYSDAAGVAVDMDKIKRSIELIKTSGKKYEFRTTVVPAFIQEEDFEAITDLVAGAESYYIQQYRPVADDGPLARAYPPEKLERLVATARNKVRRVAMRGL